MRNHIQKQGIPLKERPLEVQNVKDEHRNGTSIELPSGIATDGPSQIVHIISICKDQRQDIQSIHQQQPEKILPFSFIEPEPRKDAHHASPSSFIVLSILS